MSHPDPQFDPMDREFEGLYPNMPAEVYRSIRPALSFSGAKEMKKSPKHYRHAIDNPQEETAPMELGTQTHCATLEPELFARTYVLRPRPEHFPGCLDTLDDYKRVCKAAGIPVSGTKAELKRRILEAGLVVTAGFFDDLEIEALRGRKPMREEVPAIANSVLTDPVAGPLLKDGVAEVSAFWKDPETGVTMKARADFMRNDGCLVDLKTTSYPMDREAFERMVVNSCFHWQAALYLRGFSSAMNLLRPMTRFIHIVVETKPPYAVHTYELDEASIEKGWAELQPIIRKYAECLAKNEWPGPTPTLTPASLPSWKFGMDSEFNAQA